MKYYNLTLKSIINTYHEQQKIIYSLMVIFNLSESNASKKFSGWMETKPFTCKVGYKKILAGDTSFLNYNKYHKGE